jgi:hypothetical protein
VTIFSYLWFLQYAVLSSVISLMIGKAYMPHDVIFYVTKRARFQHVDVTVN